MRKISLIALASVLTIALLAPGAVLSQDILDLTITGTFFKSGDKYFIRGSEPREVFLVLNPKSKTLDKYVKSGQASIIEADSFGLDSVKILGINGKLY